MRSMCWTVLLRVPGQHPASSPKNGRLAPWPELASQGSGARPEKVMETLTKKLYKQDRPLSP